MNDFIETELADWSQIFKVNRYFWSPYIFRGQADSSWPLETSIERVARNFSTFSKLNFGYGISERWMIHEFKRKYPLFSNLLPEQNDNFEWLGIMQHHGAPTRLLDFTESILIAAYFAIIDAVTESSIWVINRNILRDNLYLAYKLNYAKKTALKDDVNESHIEFANKYIGSKVLNNAKDIPISVIPLDPKICTERLSRQQGLFLMPTNSKKTFLDNLASIYEREHYTPQKISFNDLIELHDSKKADIMIKIIKINIPAHIHKDILFSLKQMNITAETLFPGIDGLAKSLQHSYIRLL